jgi:Glycosyltransferase Family 4/Glycosyl transferases group 1
VRRVLFLAYYFPPLGGAGVQRSAKFVQQLPALGYEAAVVTGPLDGDVAWAPPDDSLAGDVPPGTVVHRVQGPPPTRSHGNRARAERWFRRRSPFSRWWVEGALEVGRKLAAEHEVDLIYASMSPFESGEAASVLSRELGKPWVADLRDPWALDEWLVYPTGIHRRLELTRMRRVLGAADAVVMNTPEATAEILRSFPELRRERVHTIPNGFDAADFSGPAPERSDDGFRIVHAGFVHVRAGGRQRVTMIARQLLGGAARGLDVGTRSHVYLLQAVERLLLRRPDLRGRVEVHLAGILSEADKNVPGFDVVRAHGYLPHDETVALLRSADLLFLPMHGLPPGTRARIVPGKTYEYLAAGPPVLAAVPDGDARDLLLRAGHADVRRPDDVAGLEAAVAAAVDRWLDGGERPRAKTDVVDRYERREQSKALAGVFDTLAGEPHETREPAAAEAAG